MPPAKTARVLWSIAFVWAACQFIVPRLVGSAFVVINEISPGKLDPFYAGAFYNLFFGPAAVGAVAGYYTALLLKQLPNLHSIRARTIVLVSMAALFLGIIFLFPIKSLFLRIPQDPQPVASEPEPATIPLPGPGEDFVSGFLAWFIPGLLIGQAIAIEINRHGPKLAHRKMGLIASGWGLGFALGGGLGMATVDWINALFLGSSIPGNRFMGLLAMLPYAINGLVAGLTGAWSTLRVLRAEIASSNPASVEV